MAGGKYRGGGNLNVGLDEVGLAGDHVLFVFSGGIRDLGQGISCDRGGLGAVLVYHSGVGAGIGSLSLDTAVWGIFGLR